MKCKRCGKKLEREGLLKGSQLENICSDCLTGKEIEVISSFLQLGINNILTISEAAELDCVQEYYKDVESAKRSLRGKFERGLEGKNQRGKSFKAGKDYRKAGDTWLVTKKSIEREYKEE